MDNTVKSSEDVSTVTERPILAMLPHLKSSVLSGVEQIGEAPADTITHTAPKSSFAEGIKTLRANLMFMSPDNPANLLLVTSSGPSEGKTVTSVNMAIAMAQSGLRTLIVDSDMRRPRIHKAISLENSSGLSNAIMGEISLDEGVQDTPIENLDALTCGTLPPNPSELLHAERFHEIMEEAAEKYDRVILDSPPLGAVADALILSQLVESVLLVVKFGQTRREMLERAVEQLEGIGAPFKGCVLNEVDTSGSGYGYSYYYRYSYDDESKDSRPRLVG
jgi:capsular exopolysaccharide synthesis family protein